MNKHRFVLIVAMFMFSSLHYLQAQIDYSVASIPDSLKKDAGAVIRYSIYNLAINSLKKATLKKKVTITVLNKNGLDNSVIHQYYDKFSSVNQIKATLFDADGKKIKRISGDNIYDISAITGYSIYENSRIKIIDPEYLSPPFTIEYEYNVNYKGILNFPVWNPLTDYNISVEHSKFSVSIPDEYNFRYYVQNLDDTVKIIQLKGEKMYVWEIKNHPAIRKEDMSPSLRT